MGTAGLDDIKRETEAGGEGEYSKTLTQVLTGNTHDCNIKNLLMRDVMHSSIKIIHLVETCLSETYPENHIKTNICKYRTKAMAHIDRSAITLATLQVEANNIDQSSYGAKICNETLDPSIHVDDTNHGPQNPLKTKQIP